MASNTCKNNVQSSSVSLYLFNWIIIKRNSERSLKICSSTYVVVVGRSKCKKKPSVICTHTLVSKSNVRTDASCS